MISTRPYITKPIYTGLILNLPQISTILLTIASYISTYLYITKPMCTTPTYQIALKLYLAFISQNIYNAAFSYHMDLKYQLAFILQNLCNNDIN